jgi:hypothetical protein
METFPMIVLEEFESWNVLKTITNLLSLSSCKSLVFETPKTIIVPKISSKEMPNKQINPFEVLHTLSS